MRISFPIIKYRNDITSLYSIFVIYLVTYPLVLILKYISMIYIAIETIISVFALYYGFKYSSRYSKVIFLTNAALVILELFHSYFFYEPGYFSSWVGLCLQSIVISMSWMLAGMAVYDFNRLYETIKEYEPVLIITEGLLVIYAWITGRFTTTSGNMSVSYGLLILWTLEFDLMCSRKKAKHIVLFIIISVIELGVGSRGPVLSFLVYMVFYTVLIVKDKKLVVLAILLSLVVFLNYKTVIEWLIYHFTKYNINSRTLYKILQGTVMDGTGRNDIYDKTMELIESHFYIGMGIGGERVSLFNMSINSDKTLSSVYPHNIILEILVHFGFPIGSLMLILLVFLVVRTLLSRNKNYMKLFLMIGLAEIVHLSISTTYTNSPMFYMMLGFMVSNLRGQGE